MKKTISNFLGQLSHPRNWAFLLGGPKFDHHCCKKLSGVVLVGCRRGCCCCGGGGRRRRA